MSVSLLVFIRSMVAFIVLFIFTRIIGKQQISQLTVFEYLVGITIGSIASAMSIELEIQSINGVVGMAVWTVIPVAIALGTLKSPIVRRFVQGEPRVLIRNGRIIDHNLRKERLDLDQLLMLLRQKNVFSLADVEFAILEVNGKLSVLPKADKRPVTAYDMKLQVNYEQPAFTVIKDGLVNQQRLLEAGYDSSWLKGKLAEQWIEDPKDVMIAQITSSGGLVVDRKEEWKENLNAGYEKLLAGFYRLQSDLHQFSLSSEEIKVKKDYKEMKKQMDEMIRTLETYVSQRRS